MEILLIWHFCVFGKRNCHNAIAMKNSDYQMIPSLKSALFVKLVLACLFVFSAIPSNATDYPSKTTVVDSRHTMYQSRYDTIDQAKAACYAFSGAVGYPGDQWCGHGGGDGVYGYGAGWLRTDGPTGTSLDPSFILGSFLYCSPSEQYFPDVDKCVGKIAVPTPVGPRDNGPPCCQPQVGEPINPATGNVWHSETDYAAADPSNLAIVRTYNSNRMKIAGAQLNLFGANWTHAYDAALRPIAPFIPNTRTLKCWQRADNHYIWCETITYVPPPIPEAVSISRGDGKVMDFNRQADGSWTSHGDNNDRITATISSDGTKVLDWSYKAARTEMTDRFDANGRLLSITSRTGRTQRLTYSDGTTNDTSAGRYPVDAPVCPNVQVGAVVPAGRLICATDDWGRQMQFEYDLRNRVSKMIDPAGGTYLYGFDGIYSGCTTGTGANLYACNADNLTSVTYPDGKIRTYQYNEASLINNGSVCQNAISTGAGYVHLVNAMTGLTDENGGRYITWTYDCDGMTKSSQTGNGAERVTLNYSPEDTNGLSSTYIARYLGPIGSTSFIQSAYNYQNVGGVKKNTAVSTNCPECGPYAARTYDANGNDTSRTDWAGNKSTYVYDISRNLETSRTEAVGTAQARTISTTWHSTLRLPLTIAEPKRVTRYTYDAAGNMLSRSVQATSDLNGSLGLSASSVGSARTWTYTYNSIGQILTTKGPRTDVVDVTSYTYDSSTGTLATVTNALGHVATLSDYDANGRPRTITSGNGVTSRLTYTARGALSTSTVSAAGRSEQTSYGYDSAEQLTSVTGPDGATMTFSYDQAHRLTGIQDTVGNSIVYDLDISGHRVSEKTNDPNGTLTRKISRAYDAQDFLKQVTGAAQ
jgi:YD repeat-containing protein